MRKLCLLASFLIVPVVSAQELHTFSNGEVADAEKINENFQYVLENATGSGGCSAEQDGSNVVITCADGTTGVLASEGTVVVYSGGIMGESPDTEYNTGAIVAFDATDTLLGEVKRASDRGPVIYLAKDNESGTGRYHVGLLLEDSDSKTVTLTGTKNTGTWFLDDSCAGTPFSQYNDEVIRFESKYFIVDFSQQREQILFKSYRRPAFSTYEALDCVAGEYVSEAYLTRPYTPTSEILNAAYPVRLEQLP